MALASIASNVFLVGVAFATSIIFVAGLSGCKSAPSPSATATKPVSQPTQTFSPRPTVPAPTFKVFHQTADSITLVTKESVTDGEVEAIVWQLHDAAHNHTFDKLKISQKFIDARDPKVWIHIYRGAKCASEKYASGEPPCGGSYHAAGDYTLGGFTNHDYDDGVLLHDESHEVHLWNPDAPYTPSPTT